MRVVRWGEPSFSTAGPAHTHSHTCTNIDTGPASSFSPSFSHSPPPPHFSLHHPHSPPPTYINTFLTITLGSKTPSSTLPSSGSLVCKTFLFLSLLPQLPLVLPIPPVIITPLPPPPIYPDMPILALNCVVCTPQAHLPPRGVPAPLLAGPRPCRPPIGRAGASGLTPRWRVSHRPGLYSLKEGIIGILIAARSAEIMCSFGS